MAQVPKKMSFQGVLSDASGNAMADGSYELSFALYDVETGAAIEVVMFNDNSVAYDGS